jgi:hypothetical protein
VNVHPLDATALDAALDGGEYAKAAMRWRV